MKPGSSGSVCSQVSLLLRYCRKSPCSEYPESSAGRSGMIASKGRMLRWRRPYINFASAKNVFFVSEFESFFSRLRAAKTFVAPWGKSERSKVGNEEIGASTKKTSPNSPYKQSYSCKTLFFLISLNYY